jgi:hypothetical protein
MSYKKGDPDCMTSDQAMKNITVLYKATDYRMIEAGGDYNIGDKIGIVTFKGKKEDELYKW